MNRLNLFLHFSKIYCFSKSNAYSHIITNFSTIVKSIAENRQKIIKIYTIFFLNDNFLPWFASIIPIFFSIRLHYMANNAFGILYRKTRDSPGFQDLKQSPINRLPKTIWKRAASVNIFSRNFLWKSIIGRNDLNRLLLIKHCNRLFLTSDQLR